MGNVYFERGLRLSSLLRRGKHDWLAEIGAIGQPMLLSRGRDCLYVALKAIGAEQGDAISVPAFICAEVPRLIAEWGFSPVPYDVEPDLRLSPDLVKKSLTPSTRAILYVNYFGLQQPSASLAELKEFGLPLIEDNCQAPMAGSGRGIQPDFAFTSLRKYLPVPDGAVLDVIDDRWRERVSRVTLRGRGNGQLVSWRLLALSLRNWQERRDRKTVALCANEAFAKAEQALRRFREPTRMHPISQRLASNYDISELRRARRMGYERVIQGLSGHRALRPLRPELGLDDCPYGVPLITEDSHLWRDALTRRGVQAAILWEGDHIPAEMPVASQLARQILVIPLPRADAVEQLLARFE